MFLEGRAYFDSRAADGDGTGHFARDWKTQAEKDAAEVNNDNSIITIDVMIDDCAVSR